MSCNTDLIICLWLVPVVSFLLLPLALAVVGLPLMKARRAFSSTGAVKEETRTHQRFASSEDVVTLPDGLTQSI